MQALKRNSQLVSASAVVTSDALDVQEALAESDYAMVSTTEMDRLAEEMATLKVRCSGT